MIEIELKGVLSDLDGLRRTLAHAGTTPVFEGLLEDRRYDTPDRRLFERDEVLRLRVYHGAGGPNAQLDWKGPTSHVGGYKRREELSASLPDAVALSAMLERLGYLVTMAIDRQVWQYEIGGATVRLERYPAMDDLIEVEGAAENIERAIERLELPRAAFTTDRLRDFVQRYESRTGRKAVLSNASDGGRDFDVANA